MVAAVDELQRLHQELDVHEAAAAELDVVAARRLLAQLDLHARPHLGDLLEAVGTERGAIHVAPQHGANRAGQSALAEDEAGAPERLPLPKVAGPPRIAFPPPPA